MVAINSSSKYIIPILFFQLILCEFCIASERRIIMMFGDSLTRGYGLSEELGFVSQLSQKMQLENINIELANFGVSGDTTAGGLIRFEWSLSPETSGVVLALGGNDLLRGITPDESKKNLTKILLIAQSFDLPVLLVGLTAPNNYGEAYKTKFDKIFYDLSQEFDLILYPSFLSALITDDDISSATEYFQEDGIHPNEKGVKKIVKDFFPTMKNFLDQLKQ